MADYIAGVGCTVAADCTVEPDRMVADYSPADFVRMVADCSLAVGRRRIAHNFVEPPVDSC